MDYNGNIKLIGGAVVSNARIENLAENPATPLVGQIWYNTTDGDFKYYDGTEVQTFASLDILNTAINVIATGAGLGPAGVYTADESTNYLKTATSLMDADKKLDAALKSLSDTVDGIINDGGGASQTEVDNIEAAVGLATDGTFIPWTGRNYINGATTIADGIERLDGAVFNTTTVADAAAIDATDALNQIGDVRTTAEAALPKAGGAMTGNIAMGDNTITGLAPGVNATDAVNRSQLDGALAGLDFQADVWGIQTDDTLVPDLIDGRRYILTNVADLAPDFGTIVGVVNNDIVQYDNGAFVIAYSVEEAGPGALVWNREDSTWWYFNTTWTPFGGMSGAEAGIGLEKQGNVFNVLMGAGVGQLPTNEVGLDLLAAGGLFLTVDGTAPSTDTAAQLAVLVDGTTLARSATGLKVADEGIGSEQLAQNAVTIGHIDPDLAGDGLTGGGNGALAVKLKQDGGLTMTSQDGISVNTADLPFLPIDGSVPMEGPLTLAGAPTNTLEAATKGYVDTSIANADGTYLYEGATSQTSHVVNHELGSKYVSVTVIDSSDNVIIPDGILFTSENALTVTFTAAMTCKVFVVGKKVVSN